MSFSSAGQVDLTKELRLRRWARLHYVSADQRSSDWHDIVLDEMRRRDEELDVETEEIRSRFAYVPLAPTDLGRHDRSHAAVNPPNLLNATSPQLSELPYDPAW